MLTLAIETSCDETALALVEAAGPSTHSMNSGSPRGTGGATSSGRAASLPKFKVLKNLVSSQVKIHRPFGGVVPTLAKREHAKNLPLLFRKIFEISKSESLQLAARRKFTKMNFLRANRLMKRRFIISKQIPNFKSQISKIDLIAVTVGPGLEPALWTGIAFAKDLAKEYKKPLIGVNHLEGHLYSFLLSPQKKAAISKSESLNPKRKNLEIRNLRLEFPAVSLLVSGGHTILLLMKDLTHWRKLGETRDDAAGEAFDKVGRLLNLPYPGGPEIEKMAYKTYRSNKSNRTYINFPRPMLNQKNYDFSFSGLKTSVFYYLRDIEAKQCEKIREISRKGSQRFASKADIAASFQQAVIDTLVHKTIRAVREFGAKSVILCGGVAANKKLRRDMRQETRKLELNFLVPEMKYNGDNAAMIAAAGYLGYLRSKNYELKAQGGLNI